MTITLNGTTGITTPDLTSTDDITANSSAVLTSASLPTALNATGSAPIYAARAWVNFNGTGTVAIRASGNVSSITDNGTGDYTVNYTTAMPDANYAVACLAQHVDSTTWYRYVVGPQNTITLTSATFRLLTSDFNGSASDTDTVCVTIFR